MFQLEVGENKLRELLKSISKNDERAQLCLSKGTISFEILDALYSELWSQKYSMKELVVPGVMKFNEKHVAGSDYSEEFKAQLNRLRAVQEEKEYQQMINRDGLYEGSDENEAPSVAQMNKEIKEQVSAVFNVLLTVFGSVYAVWYATGYGWDIHLRVLLCLFSGILVLIADVVMYNAYYRKIEEARRVERGKKESKKVLKRLV